MSKCNIFKPLASKTGEFLMFSQYTEDITKEQSMKSTYRVVPSKFVALDLNIDKVFNNPNQDPAGPIIRIIGWNGMDPVLVVLIQLYLKSFNHIMKML